MRSKEQTALIWATERLQQSLPCASTMARKSPSRHVGVDYFPSDHPGHWRQDPISLIPLALGAHWGECIPFVINSATQFRAPPPPAMTSAAYTAAYNEVKSLGGDGSLRPRSALKSKRSSGFSGLTMERRACARHRNSITRSR